MYLTYIMSVNGAAIGSSCLLFSTSEEGEVLLVMIPIDS